ncbi:MAG: DUF3823 domain-containing protein [Carboxylicivirga sp.]|jgi:hypothetical protein|nr:DUF3823 domain-containing protein [Carboxylicivirga sp.]
MKLKYTVMIFALVLVFVACEVDNYKEPGSLLKGKLLYQGKEIATKGAQMRIELYEKGWDFEKEIGLKVDQDGHFSEFLFNGSYKLYLKNGRGSFTNFTVDDSIHFELNGNKELDIEVEPYFFVNEPTYSVSGNTLTATLSIDKIVAEKEIGDVKLLVGKTTLLDEQYKEIAEISEEVSNLSNVTISTDISALKSKGYCFVRVAVGTQGISTYNFSFVKKIDL